MSVFCQFCDKEMAFEGQATIVSGFITCGAHECQGKANYRVEEFAREARAKEEHTSRMVIFSTKTPEDDSTWRLVKQADHPHAVRNVEVMGHMKLGHYIFDESEKVYYCAKTSLEVINQAKEAISQDPCNE